SGAYHPLGASNAAAVTGDLQRNTAMSIYTVGGTSGYALGPLLGALAFGLFGRQGTIALLPVGLLAATLVLRSLARLGIGGPRPERALQATREPIYWRALLPVLGVVMLKNWVYLSVLTFVPLWYREMGYGSAFYGALTSLVIACGAVGTIVGGLLGDRLSERSVLMASLTLALPALFLFVGVPGPIALVTGPLFGMLSDSSLSITLVMAQRCLPGRVGLASGFILGMGFVTGGIGVPITGRLADRIGTPSALMVVSLLLAAAIACALLIPRGALARARAPLQPAPATD
ncbi:MAG: MFS transporter, partial [Thermomicrobiaceae bacterium]|nr:MFS transporter [Thermomicrobiaceae bacterium]